MKLSTSFRYFSSVFFFFFILFIVATIAEEYSNAEEEDLQADYCMYTLGVMTGNVENAGTDSRISISMGVKGRPPVSIPNLKSKGVMKPGHDYFEKGNLDFFVVNGLCLPSKVCRITVTSDGTGNYPGWYLEYVEITTIGPNRPVIRSKFPVNEWLSSSAPYKLFITRNRCDVRSQGSAGEEEGVDDDITKVDDTDFVVRTWGEYIDLLAS